MRLNLSPASGLSTRWRGKDKIDGVGAPRARARGYPSATASDARQTRETLALSRKLGHIVSINRMARRCVAALAAYLAFAVVAEAQQVGSATGLRVPRYVSLKFDRVNLREGPSMDHRTLWIFQRVGLPVEITAEFEIWRRIRDSEGSEGWVRHSILSGRRTALVAPWKKGVTFDLRAEANDGARVAARLQSGVIANVKTCDGRWCRVFGDDYDGYIAQQNLWGVYPDEKLP